MNNSKIILFTALGVVFWFTAAMIIRFCGAMVFSENNPMMLLFFVLAIPVTFVFMYVTTLIAKLRFNELLKPVVIMTFTAAFLDGIALTWFRQLYSESFEVALHGAAWILWGVGLGLLFALVLENMSSEDRKVFAGSLGTCK
jgi:Family of unknown function (DUF5367)